MPALSRADTSVLGRWWWTVDRWTLVAITMLIGVGYVMMLAASPSVAERIHVVRDMFILKQVVFLAVASLVVVAVSLLSPRGVRRVAVVGGLIALALTAMTLVVGADIKGARRWIALPFVSLQPSEFLKPCFAVAAAWLLAEAKKTRGFPGAWIALGVFALIALLLKSQPDIGMLAVITAVLFLQFFVSGLPMMLVGLATGVIGAAAVVIYTVYPHVQKRVADFRDLSLPGNYQVRLALEAFGNGGLLGRGPGEGHVKDLIPDVHADFVFAVAGEEFGLVVCLVIIAVFAFIVLRGFTRVKAESDPYVVLAATGLAGGFGFQALVNLATTVHLMPTKGMTLPFVSYGGSSAVAVALGMGMLLALTRRRPPGEPL
jgi:cell division protein FtsW